MKSFDLKDRDFYDSLTDEERKKFSNYLMIRWGSTVLGESDLQEYYLLSVNQRLNKHFFSINRHPKLQWLCATTVSPGLGVARHQWIKPLKKTASVVPKTSGSTELRKKIEDLYPHLRNDEVELMLALSTKEEIKELNKAHGEE